MTTSNIYIYDIQISLSPLMNDHQYTYLTIEGKTKLTMKPLDVVCHNEKMVLK